MTHYKKRKDANHADIVKTFRALGCAVADLYRDGGGIPDLLVSKHGENVLVEIKTEKGKPTKAQDDFARAWKGEIRTVRNVEDCEIVTDWLLNQALLKMTSTRLIK